MKYYNNEIQKKKIDLENAFTIMQAYKIELDKINNQMINDNIEKVDYRIINTHEKIKDTKIDKTQTNEKISNNTISVKSTKKNTTSFIEKTTKKPILVMGFIDKLASANLKTDHNDKNMNLRTKKMILL